MGRGGGFFLSFCWCEVDVTASGDGGDAGCIYKKIIVLLLLTIIYKLEVHQYTYIIIFCNRFYHVADVLNHKFHVIQRYR